MRNRSLSKEGADMERLTNRELYDGKVCFTKCSKTNCPDKCAYCDIPKEANARLKEYEDLEEQGKLFIQAYEICEVPDCPHCGHMERKVREVMIQPRLLDHSVFYRTKDEAEAALDKMKNEQ